MPDVNLRTHPSLLLSYTPNHVDIIVRIENKSEHIFWAEADISVPEKLSLSPDNSLKKGRLRLGIVEKNQYIEKSAKVYANAYTNPQMYRCKATVYFYNKDGVIENRLEKPIDLRCEIKKQDSL